MILPTKHMSQDRATLTVGARLLLNLNQPKTVSSLWDEVTRSVHTEGASPKCGLRYDAYVLALDLLFALGAIQIEDGLLSRARS